MFGLFSQPAPQLQGSAAIDDALGQFEQIAEQLERGAADNWSQAEANKQAIRELHAHNDTLSQHASRGAAVARKLREFIAS